MKVILRETHENLGDIGDQVDVKPGFARNYLIPQGIAYPASRFYLKLFDAERAELLQRDALARARAEEMAGKAAGVALEYVVKINERGQMHGAITNKDVARDLVEKGIEVDRRKIQLLDPIKKVGEFTVPVKLHGEVGFSVQINVIPEEKPEDELTEEELAERQAQAEKLLAKEEAAAAEATGEGGEPLDPGERVEVVEMVEAASEEEEEGDAAQADTPEDEKPAE